MNTMLGNIAAVQTSEKLNGEAKTAAIKFQLDTFKQSLDALGEVSQLDLGKYFNTLQSSLGKQTEEDKLKSGEGDDNGMGNKFGNGKLTTGLLGGSTYDATNQTNNV